MTGGSRARPGTAGSAQRSRHASASKARGRGGTRGSSAGAPPPRLVASANLHQPAPAQHLRRLAPLALDQLGFGILQAIQSAWSLVENIAAENSSAGQYLRRLTPPGRGEDEAIRQIRLGIEAAAHARCTLSGHAAAEVRRERLS